MNSTQIRCFLEAARSLNFAFAASGMHITPSALSKNISALERELDLTLFIRDRRVRLTPGGAVLYKHLSEISDGFSRCVRQAQLANRGLSGTLNVGYLATQHINTDCARHIAGFEKKYPNIYVSVQYENFRPLLDKLRGGEIDVAVSATFDVESEEDLAYREIAWTRNLLVVPMLYSLKNSRLGDEENPKLSEFCNETFLTLSKDESEFITPLIINSCARAGFEPKLLEAPDLETLLLWLEMGRGIFALNEDHSIFRSAQIRTFEFPEFPPITLSTAWLKKSENPCIPLFAAELPDLNEKC